jgi:hypothetical protein
MGVMLESMAIEMPAVKGHPNRVGFKGVLTIVDVASDRPPAGARGHRVLLTRRAAEVAMPSLLGMALDYAPAFDRHDVRRKVGVITRAEIVGRGIEVSGFLYARDFPEIVEEIGRKAPSPTPTPSASSGQALAQRTGKGGAATDGLGMSYEIADAQIQDMHASVWVLNKVTFTGAAILLREKAAYRATWIELEASRG